MHSPLSRFLAIAHPGPMAYSLERADNLGKYVCVFITILRSFPLQQHPLQATRFFSLAGGFAIMFSPLQLARHSTLFSFGVWIT